MAVENVRINYQVIKDSLEAANKELEKLADNNKLAQDEADKTTKKFKSQDKQLASTNSLLSGMGGQLTSLGNQFNIAGKGLGDMAAGMFNVAAGTNTVSKSMRVLKIAIASTGIGALVIALASVTAYLTKTESGSRRLSRTMSGLGTVADMIMGKFAKMGEAMVDATKKSTEEAKKTQPSLWKVMTESIRISTNLGRAISGVADEMTEAFKKGAEIDDMRVAYRNWLGMEIKLRAEMEDTAGTFRATADDATLSFEEMMEANKKAMIEQEKLANSYVEDARRKLELIDKEVTVAEELGLLQDELRNRQLAANAELIQAQSNLSTLQYENAKVGRQLAQDAWEQDLDFAIDVGTRRIEQQLKVAQNEKLTMDERKRAFEEAKQLETEAAENQIALFEQVGLSRETINRLLNESNAKVIADELKKTELSEIERNRFREFVLERDANLTALAETEQKMADDRMTQKEAELEMDTRLREAVGAKTIIELEAQGKLIEAEMVRREVLLSNEELIAQEREAIIAESEARITAIKTAQAEKQKEMDKAVKDANIQAMDDMLTAAQGFAKEGTALGKAVALASIAHDTGKAIASLTAMSEANAANAFTFGGAGILQYMAGLVRIASNIASAKTVLQTAPKFEQGGRIGGQLHSQGGTLIEAERDEFVMSRKATAKYGFNIMDKINNLELNPLTLKDSKPVVQIVDTQAIAKQLKEMPQNIIQIDGEGFTLSQRRGQDIINRKLNRYSVS